MELKDEDEWSITEDAGVEPSIIVTTPKGWSWWTGKTWVDPVEEEVDPFDEWVSQVKQLHKRPKNYDTRQFLDRRYRAGRYRR